MCMHILRALFKNTIYRIGNGIANSLFRMAFIMLSKRALHFKQCKLFVIIYRLLELIDHCHVTFTCKKKIYFQNKAIGGFIASA